MEMQANHVQLSPIAAARHRWIMFRHESDLKRLQHLHFFHSTLSPLLGTKPIRHHSHILTQEVLPPTKLRQQSGSDGIG
jgi:hypothetical protein